MEPTQTAKTAQIRKQSSARKLKEQKIAFCQERIAHDKEAIAKMEAARSAIAGTDVMGLTVSHKIFGNGIITDQTHSSITVKFELGDKRLGMPSAFVDGFLTVDNLEITGKFNQYKEMGEKIKQAREDMRAAVRSIQILEKK